MPKNLSKIAKQKKIKYFLISFVDLFGVLRSKLVPAQAINEMQKNGAGFAGFAGFSMRVARFVVGSNRTTNKPEETQVKPNPNLANLAEPQIKPSKPSRPP